MTRAAFRPRHITLSFWDRKLLQLHERVSKLQYRDGATFEEFSTHSVVVMATHNYHTALAETKDEIAKCTRSRLPGHVDHSRVYQNLILRLIFSKRDKRY
jgi:hypothetical protein